MFIEVKENDWVNPDRANRICIKGSGPVTVKFYYSGMSSGEAVVSKEFESAEAAKAWLFPAQKKTEDRG